MKTLGKILGNIVSNTTNINDEVIASKSIASAKAASKAYLSGILCSTTPELRTLFTSHLTQILSNHAALQELSVRNKWLETYNSSRYQLKSAYDKSKHLLKQDQ
jgi:spore coat protein CotF